MSIRLLTFDLDDTLWDLRPVLLRADQLAFDWLLEQAPTLADHYTAESFRQARLHLAQQRPELAHRVSELRRLAQTLALQQAGLALARAQELSARAFDIFVAARHEIEFFESALDVLEILRRDYLLAAVTNGNASPARLGLDNVFAFTVNAEDLPHSKPHAAPFEAALARAQCAAHEAIHIGDHVDHDIRGAMAIGMHAIWINRAGAPWAGEDVPDAEVRHLAQLPDAVAAIAAMAGRV